MKMDKCKINSRIEAILLYFSVVLLADEGMSNEFPTIRLWGMAIVMYGILYGISKLSYKVLIGVLLVSVGTYSFWSPKVSAFDATGLAFEEWLNAMNVKNPELHNSIYSYIILALICYLGFLLAEAFVMAHKEKQKGWLHKIGVVVRYVVGVGAVFYGIWMFISNMQIHKSTIIVLFLLCYYVCLNQQEHIGKFSWLERGWCPFILSTVLFFAPTGDTFTEIQKWEPYQRTRAVLTEILPGRQGFYFGYTGFGTDATLKENILPTYNDAMKVTAKDGQELGNFYLIGNVWDTFSDNSWEKQNESAVYYGQSESQGIKVGYSEWELDQLDFYMATRFLWDGTSYYSDDRKIQVTYDDLYTTAAFFPLKSTNLKADIKWKEAKSGIQFEELLGKEDSYEVEFYNIDWETFGYFLETGVTWPFTKEELVQPIVLSGENGVDIDALWEAVQERRNAIQEQYTQLPDDFSEKLTACAEKITSTEDTVYGKAQRLETFFKEFEYNTNPPITPKDDNFLERFVLESKSGYCTYFATAMTLMCRSVGIPARYVQGFVVCGDGQTEVTVSDSDSHAWTEVYIEGVGWCPFEPTPGYEDLRYDESAFGMDRTSSSEEILEPDVQKEQEEDKEPSGNTEEPSTATEMPKTDSTSNGDANQAAKSVVGWELAIIPAALVMVAVVCYLIFRISRKRKYKEFGEQAESMLEVHKLLRVLKKKGYKRKPEETFREFTQRCSSENEAWQNPLSQITNLYEKLVYGEKPLSAEEEQALVDAIKQIKQT